MGEAADLILEGYLCADCGVYIDDESNGYDGACGYPRYCRECGGVPEVNGQKVASSQRQKKKRGR